MGVWSAKHPLNGLQMYNNSVNRAKYAGRMGRGELLRLRGRGEVWGMRLARGFGRVGLPLRR